MFGLFDNPKCPKCGMETTETGYSFPYPQYRCRPCMNRSEKEKSLQKRVDDLESKLERVSKGNDDG